MIRVNATKPFIEIDGTRYNVRWQVARLAEVLLNKKGPVHLEQVKADIEFRSTKSLYTCANAVREVLIQHGYQLVTSAAGYEIIKVAAVEFEAAKVVTER